MAVVLVIDDEPEMRDIVCELLESGGHAAIKGRHGLPARLDVVNLSYDLLITDISMPEVDGLELIRLVKTRNPALPIIAISGGTSRLQAETALRLGSRMGADASLAKPIKRAELLTMVNLMLER
jgi:CheY-like chemotaxis protein